MIAKRLFILFFLLLSGGKIASSYANENIDAFIERVKTVSYDCPNTDDFQQLEAYLASDSLSSAQRLALSVERSHFLICEGQVSKALRLRLRYLILVDHHRRIELRWTIGVSLLHFIKTLIDQCCVHWLRNWIMSSTLCFVFFNQNVIFWARLWKNIKIATYINS